MIVRESARLAFSAADRLLVVAPHPDDEALACGGALATAAAAGAAVGVAYLTDGAASHPRTRAALRDIREAEAVAGLAALGIDASAATFFRGPDGRLDPHDALLTARLAALAHAFRPTVVLGPFERDAHPDHRATSAILAAALEGIGSTARHLRYAVWLAHRGPLEDQITPDDSSAWVVDTRDVLAAKRRAIAAHRSQFGRVVRDDPSGFRIPHDVIVRACAREERFLERARPGRATA